MRVDVLLRRTMGLWDEQDRFGSFPSSIRTEKVPRAGGGLSPCEQSPRIIKQYAPIAKANRQARQARRRRSPCRRSSISAGFDVSALCIARTGRGNNRIHMTQKQSRKQTQRKSKSKAQAKRGSVIYSNAITKKQA